MPAGRPQKSRFAAADLDGAWHEMLVLGYDDRLRISVDVSRRCPWLAPGQEVLAILGSQHRVRLAPRSDAAAIEAQLQHLAAEQKSDSEHVEVAIRRRYLRLRVNGDARITLPKDVRFCLGLDPVAPAYVSLTIGRQHVVLEGEDASVYLAAEELLEEYDLP